MSPINKKWQKTLMEVISVNSLVKARQFYWERGGFYYAG